MQCAAIVYSSSVLLIIMCFTVFCGCLQQHSWDKNRIQERRLVYFGQLLLFTVVQINYSFELNQ